jgi:iron complex outermembrane receptor protein
MKGRTSLATSVALGVALAGAPVLHAANAPVTATSELEEVVVTSRFIDEGANSSMKLGIAVRDTPFSIGNYTNSFMKAIETTQVADLYRYMTGLQKAGGTGYDLTLRGFSTTDLDRNTVMTDGLPGLSVRFGSPPTIGTDHIELVRGTASLLYGAVQPGGFVNIITKKPRAEAATELTALGTTGASTFHRVHGGALSFDSTGPIGSGSQLLYRVIGQVSYDNKFRDGSYERTSYLAPMITWRLGDKTTVTGQYEYRTAEANYSSFYLLAPRKTPLPATVAQLAPINTNYIGPGNYLNEKGTVGSLFVEHDFANGAIWKVTVRDVTHRDWAHAFDVGPFDRTDPTFNTLDIRARGQSNLRTYVFGDSNVILPFQTGSVGHKLIAGVSFGREVDDFVRTQFCNIAAPGRPTSDPTCNLAGQQFTISILNPDFSRIPAPDAFGPGVIGASTRARNYNASEGSGAYVSDLLTLTAHWKALLGLRYAREQLEDAPDLFEPALATFNQSYSKTLPQAGLIYQPTDHWSFYGSYSTSFAPVDPANIGLTTQPTFTPTQGNGAEIGAKATLYNGRIDLTAALFTIHQKNVLAPYSGSDVTLCPSGGCVIQVGGARSKGIEAEVSATPVDHWTILAGWAYTNARISESSPSGPLVDHLLPNSPLNAAHVWSRYDFTSGSIAGYGIGVGLSYVGERVTNTATPAVLGEFTLPSYEVVDLGIYKSFGKNVDMTVKLNNVLDKLYYNSGTITQGLVNVQPGFPRSAQLTFRARL